MRPFRRFLTFATIAYAAWTVTVPTLGPAAPPLAASLPHIPITEERIPRADYQRAAFGSGWASTGTCTTRERELLAQIPGSTQQPGGCKVSGGSANDPYAPGTITSTEVELDHVYPLAAAWDLGAWEWSPAQRQQFANDPINLIVVSRAANREKSDQLPSQWLPSRRPHRCWYARRVAAVAAAYELALPAADVAAIRRQCLLLEWAPPMALL